MPSPSVEFQDAVLAALNADAAVAALVGARIYDAPPAAGRVFPYLSFGPSDFVRDDMDCVEYRLEALQIDCWARAEGRLWPGRELVDAVVACLHGAELDLATHALAKLLVSSARVMGDPDGVTAHGVVLLEAEIEQR